MRVFLLTVGTRGDVEPFLALGRRLQQAGHDVTVATTSSFAPWVERQGLRYAYLNNDLLQLTTGDAGRAAIEQFGGGPLGKARWVIEAARRFKPIFRRLLREEWEAARGANLVVFHPNAVGGIHIAEALGVPGVMADLVPTWVPTGEFPSVVFPDPKVGKWYNRMTYRFLPALTRGMYGSVVSQWRRDSLGLPPRPWLASDLVRGDGRPVPVLQAFSGHVVPRPADWPETVRLTGYWFLDDAEQWQPSRDLVAFLEGGPPPVFVGFGSMLGRDPASTTRTVVEALDRAGQRGIVVTGWGGLRTAQARGDVFVTDAVPYDWLLPRVAAAVHHGGAGTTAAGLRAGKPSVVCPFVADQPFWGKRVAALGVGPHPIAQRHLNADNLAAAIATAVSDEGMRERAALLGSRIREEDGVGTAVAFLEEVMKGERAVA